MGLVTRKDSAVFMSTGLIRSQIAGFAYLTAWSSASAQGSVFQFLSFKNNSTLDKSLRSVSGPERSKHLINVCYCFPAGNNY